MKQFEKITRIITEDSSMNEGILTRALGTAALAGALNFNSPANAQHTRHPASSIVQPSVKQKQIQHNIITRTLWAEARNGGEEGMRAVASVIYNRGGGNLEEMIKEIKTPRQFSCWNKMTWRDWSKFKLKYRSGPEWDIASKIAYEMVQGKFKRTTVANHYYNPKLAKPNWAFVHKKIRPHFKVGDHVFMTIG